jgi:hypothetical protein
VSGQVGFAGSGHGNYNHLCLLALELVHGANPGVGRQNAFEQIDLHVVRGYHQDAFQAQGMDFSVTKRS